MTAMTREGAASIAMLDLVLSAIRPLPSLPVLRRCPSH
jgi:hypothetical protein